MPASEEMRKSVFPPPIPRYSGKAETWLENALKELAELDDEIAEEGLPEIEHAVKEEARRITTELAGQPVAPAIYPTRDGEIAIHFKSPASPSTVVVLLSNDGQGACFSYSNGKSRRARYDDSSELPDAFVRAHLSALIDTAA